MSKVEIKIPGDRWICKYCYHCECNQDTVGGAYCTADIHNWISDVNSGNICCDFDYDDTFERY